VKNNLTGSDDGVYHSESLGLWTADGNKSSFRNVMFSSYL
jgi:hypothetical protein